MAGNNSNLGAAKRAKNDEFYTQLTDIEKELRHYRKHFRGATVLCNCDDPFESNFFKFFVLNFDRLGLKKLIATCYEGSAVAEYRDGKAKPYKAVVTTVHDTTGDGGVDMEDVRNLFELGENELVSLRVTVISAPRSAWHCSTRRTSWSRIRRSRCSESMWPS